MVIQALLMEGFKALEGIEYSNNQQESRLILSHLLGVDRSYLYAHGSDEVPESVVVGFREIIDRRKEGEPLQYILGFQDFMGLKLVVRKGVLIPRGDTELLVQRVIEHVNVELSDRPFRMLDIGIGTGAISLAVASSMSKGEIIGVDISEEALSLAEENRKRLRLENVRFLKSDLFSGLSNEWFHSFDIIASNPPYIPNDEINGLQKEVRLFEPTLALSGGSDGLDYYRRITSEAVMFLKKNGLLIYEVGAGQGDAVSEIMKENGFTNINVVLDLENRDRVVAARL